MTRNHTPKRTRQGGNARSGTSESGQANSRRKSTKTPSVQQEPAAGAYDKLSKIAGLAAVTALFKHAPERAMRLYYEEGLKAQAGSFCSQLAKDHKPYRMVDSAELSRIAGTPMHGGIVAAALAREVPPLNIKEARSWAQARESVLILDGVGNPHNLGAIARTMAFFGVKHLLISDHPGQSGLSDSAYRVAEGGLDVLEVHRISHLAKSLKDLQSWYQVVGTALSCKAQAVGALAADQRPMALVLGNEEDGLSPQTLAACEQVVMLPGSGAVQSLNVSVTAGILIYQLMGRARGQGE